MSSDTILILLSLAATTAWLSFLIAGNQSTSSVKVDVKLDDKQPEWFYKTTSPARNNNESI